MEHGDLVEERFQSRVSRQFRKPEATGIDLLQGNVPLMRSAFRECVADGICIGC